MTWGAPLISSSEAWLSFTAYLGLFSLISLNPLKDTVRLALTSLLPQAQGITQGHRPAKTELALSSLGTSSCLADSADLRTIPLHLTDAVTEAPQKVAQGQVGAEAGTHQPVPSGPL